MTDHSNRRGKVTEEHLKEAARLKAIWDATYEERKTKGLHTQDAFGQEYGIGNQAAVGFFLNGRAALSMKAARGFAAGLGCSIADFSERLAKEAEMTAAVANTTQGSAAELAKRMANADEATRRLIEIALLEDDEQAASQLTPSLVSLVRAMKDMIREQGNTR